MLKNIIIIITQHPMYTLDLTITPLSVFVLQNLFISLQFVDQKSYLLEKTAKLS